MKIGLSKMELSSILQSRFVGVIALLVIGVIYLSSCRKDVVDKNVLIQKPNSDTVQVWMQTNMVYNPDTVNIKVNTTVLLINKDVENHTVTSFTDTTLLNSATLIPGDTYSHKFTSAGSFHYYCQVHGPSMNGWVIVQ